MRGRARYGLPHPAGNVSPLGDVHAAIAAIQQRLIDCGPRVVLVDAGGHVYLLAPGTTHARDALVGHPDWCAGTFTAAADVDDLREAIMSAYQPQLIELQRPARESWAPPRRAHG